MSEVAWCNILAWCTGAESMKMRTGNRVELEKFESLDLSDANIRFLWDDVCGIHHVNDFESWIGVSLGFVRYTCGEWDGRLVRG